MKASMTTGDQILAETSVLLVDDERFMRNIVARVLEDMGCKRVKDVASGAEALKYLSIAGVPADILILDLQMPDMSGFELLKIIRESDRVDNNDIPTIILSGHSAPKFLQKTAKLGIHGYLVKPVTGKKLRENILRALRTDPIDSELLQYLTER